MSDRADRWREEALCAQTNPDLFFPEIGDHGNAAKRVCAQCPVRLQCLEHALTTEEQFGVWGGATVVERNRILRGAA